MSARRFAQKYIMQAHGPAALLAAADATSTSDDDELDMGELRLDGECSPLEIVLEQLVARALLQRGSKRHHWSAQRKTQRVRCDHAAAGASGGASQLEFPPLPSLAAGSPSLAASGAHTATSTCWAGSASTLAVLQYGVTAMVCDSDVRPGGEPESSSRRRVVARARGKRPHKHLEALAASEPPISKGEARRLRGTRSWSVAQQRRASARQARREAEAAGAWERQLAGLFASSAVAGYK